MERDWELCREILRRLRVKPETSHYLAYSDFEDLGHSKEKFGYHVFLLNDAGLILALESNNPIRMDGYRPAAITWTGQDFLEAAQKDSIWTKAFEYIEDKGTVVTLEVLKLALSEVAKNIIAS